MDSNSERGRGIGLSVEELSDRLVYSLGMMKEEGLELVDQLDERYHEGHLTSDCYSRG